MLIKKKHVFKHALFIFYTKNANDIEVKKPPGMFNPIGTKLFFHVVSPMELFSNTPS